MSETSHDPRTVLTELNAASIGLDQAADELRRLMPRYEGYEDKAGVFHPGCKIRWQEAVDDHIDALVQSYEDREKRAPAKEVLVIRATKRAKADDRDLWAEFHATDARITALQTWAASKSKTISAKQSILRAEGILAGVQPHWSQRSAA